MSISSISGAFGGFYTSLSGLNDAGLRSNVVANNVANANTDNFVPDRVVSQAVPGGGIASTVQAGIPPEIAPIALNPDGSFPSQTSYVEEGVNLIMAKAAYGANAAAIGVQNDISKTLMDILG